MNMPVPDLFEILKTIGCLHGNKGKAIQISDHAIRIQAIFITQAHGPRYGLHLNTRKCVVLLGPRSETSIAQDDQMRFRAILKESPVHITPKNAAQKSQRETSRTYGSKLLGIPIGSDDYGNE
jgi:hypothetical protein